MALPANPANLVHGSYHSSAFDPSGNITQPDYKVPWQLRDDPVGPTHQYDFEF